MPLALLLLDILGARPLHVRILRNLGDGHIPPAFVAAHALPPVYLDDNAHRPALDRLRLLDASARSSRPPPEHVRPGWPR